MTPYEKIINVFHSMFQSNEILPDGLEQQFFINAVGEYETELTELGYDDKSNTFKEPLTSPQIQILGMLMYKGYLGRYRDRALKLNNVVGRDIQLTGLANTKAQVNRAYEDLIDDIEKKLSKLKMNNFD
ncbi:hypothetical protein P9G40_18765 [Bacillus velezensis]|uniref:Uncharacterized protein n=1 Tax=Bacillus velezensis TaxID=492670 RepID=A0ABC8DA36_BACVE|nr:MULTISPECIES: hypothetical protein [Bacillus]ANB49243.1 hypothetical protein A1D33_018315 [Bacillus velezensis]AVI29027.1 hypothetical protein C3Z10_11825 [Bacillus velezensis]AWX72680.1 hypothetical protein BVDSYZ_11850 [Bacillus velezensis]MBR7816737.1 hypothetical protein [Bacillus sp. CCNWLCWHY013]MCP9020057.1 hypothetical protein [Bacillus velezensis]